MRVVLHMRSGQHIVLNDATKDAVDRLLRQFRRFLPRKLLVDNLYEKHRVAVRKWQVLAIEAAEFIPPKKES